MSEQHELDLDTLLALCSTHTIRVYSAVRKDELRFAETCEYPLGAYAPESNRIRLAIQRAALRELSAINAERRKAHEVDE